jgi:propanol-preferring alcohol dehydrogenase
MRAMMLRTPRTPLELVRRDDPRPGRGQVVVAVKACGVCRTDLHLVDGELPQARLPIVPGHEIVGSVVAVGSDVDRWAIGDRVGIPWLGATCGACRYCRAGDENLCDAPEFTGCTIDGGYADFVAADARYCFRLPDDIPDIEIAPWLCAGLIGYRSLRKAGDARRLGIYGFGAAAHIIAQVAAYEGRETYAFTRPGDIVAQGFARDLGAAWAGGSDEATPEPLDAAIVLAPVGGLVPKALRDVVKGGVVICGGIHMSDIPGFPYALLWGERRVCSVANLTRADGQAFIDLARRVPVRTTVSAFPLERANDALAALRHGALRGAAVLRVA